MPDPLQTATSPPVSHKPNQDAGFASSSRSSHFPSTSAFQAPADPSNLGTAAHTSSALGSTSTSADAESSRANLNREEIEMAPLTPAGHRRRRSSLMASSTEATAAARSSRLPTQSIKNTGVSPQEEPKIIEEDHETNALQPDGGEDDSLSDEDLHDDEETGLTRKDRQRKRRKRVRQARLDQRIVPERISAEERKKADKNVVRQLMINILLIGLWYLFSLSISLVSALGIDPQRACSLSRRRSSLATSDDGSLTHACSTTSGCLMATGSISHSHCSQLLCTC